MTRTDVTSILGGKPRRISEQTIVWEGQNAAWPMTLLEQRMYEMICQLTKP